MEKWQDKRKGFGLQVGVHCGKGTRKCIVNKSCLERFVMQTLWGGGNLWSSWY